jgi:hypothetical protein
MTPQQLIALYEAKVCPCCGFQLWLEPWSGNGRFQSDEICPCCGIQFGYTDSTPNDDLLGRIEIYLSFRQNWIKSGMKFKHENAKPNDWNPQEQLERLRNVD